ncbi:MAG: OST-HTH/LOTUS domain-containing protein, partial [Bradyrhizobium sp.]|nr:OST-HTH/LOTUS domain-containing protein [Bradyrhizobium sp.]
SKDADSAAVPKSLLPVSAATPMIKKVITQMESEDGWVALGEVGKQLSNLVSDFDPRTYGCRKLSDLVRKTGGFEIEEQSKGGGSVRIRVKAATAPQPRARAPRGHREAAKP